MKYILMDVEGTTSSISFVHDVLFPYSLTRIEFFIHENLNEPTVQRIVKELKVFLPQDIANDQLIDQVILLLKKWIHEDRKHPLLKELQGLIWKQGYETGELKGHVYEDVPIAFKNWAAQGIKLGIYSSGSVLAQRMLFGNSLFGNLNPWISDNFDTAAGPKKVPQSYREISDTIKTPAKQICFLSDSAEEIHAAEEVGLRAIQILREGRQSTCALTTAHNFLEIVVE